MTHDELARSLAAHIRGATDHMVWTDMMVGRLGSVRPDVLTLARTYNVALTIYEVKVSRADFLADVNAGKWLEYLKHARCVYFAAPDGLLKPAEVPSPAGLIVHRDGRWRYARKPKPQPQPTLSSDFWLKLLLDGIDREVDARTRTRGPRNEYLATERALSKVGATVAAALRDEALAEADAKRRAAMHHDEIRRYNELEAAARQGWAVAERTTRDIVERACSDVAVAMGLHPNTPALAVAHRIRVLARPMRVQQEEVIKTLERNAANLARTISKMREELGNDEEAPE